MKASELTIDVYPRNSFPESFYCQATPRRRNVNDIHLVQRMCIADFVTLS